MKLLHIKIEPCWPGGFMHLPKGYAHYPIISEACKRAVEDTGHTVFEVPIHNRCYFNTVISELKGTKTSFQVFRLIGDSGIVIATTDEELKQKLESYRKLCAND